MSQRPSLGEVEARVRGTLLERSRDPERLVTTFVTPRRRRIAPWLLSGAAAVAIAAIVFVSVGDDDRPNEVVAADDPAPASTCGNQLPIEVTVPGGTEDAVEIRWPAPSQPVYGRRLTSKGLVVGTTVSSNRFEVEMRSRAIRADVIVESRLSAEQRAALRPPCDVLQLTVVTAAGQWTTGLDLAPDESDAPFGMIDLEPRIVERGDVGVAPTAAIRCQGSDQFGTPPNRSGGPDPAIHGRLPAEVLVGYLAANPTAVPSGYVEMLEPDGSVTYGVDPSGDGWTTLVFVGHRAGDWFLEGWTASGC